MVFRFISILFLFAFVSCSTPDDRNYSYKDPRRLFFTPKEYFVYAELPPLVRHYLDSTIGKPGGIAEPWQPYSWGCIRMPGEASCQFQKAVAVKNGYVIKVKTGGIAPHEVFINLVGNADFGFSHTLLHEPPPGFYKY